MSSISNWLSPDSGFLKIAIVAAVVVAAALILAVVYRLVFGHRLRVPGASRARQPRLGLVDAFSLDGQRQLVLVRRDNVEHLIMIGGPNDVLLESQIVRAAAASREPSLKPPVAAVEAPHVPVDGASPRVEAAMLRRAEPVAPRPPVRPAPPAVREAPPAVREPPPPAREPTGRVEPTVARVEPPPPRMEPPPPPPRPMPAARPEPSRAPPPPPAASSPPPLAAAPRPAATRGGLPPPIGAPPTIRGRATPMPPPAPPPMPSPTPSEAPVAAHSPAAPSPAAPAPRPPGPAAPSSGETAAPAKAKGDDPFADLESLEAEMARLLGRGG